ncbi:MAG: SpoIIIAH-like family protein [Clostridia bacterium]
MNFIKKSKVALLSLTLMLVVAGYINYEYNSEREKELGKTVYVSSNVNNVKIYEDNIAVFKNDREKMFSELSENYRSVISNKNSDVNKISEYQSKLNELVEKKNLIAMVENIIKSKGIKDVAIIPTNTNYLNVVIKSEESMSNENIEKVKKIIMSEFKVKSDKISVTVDKTM